jgi:hypothetical protein
MWIGEALADTGASWTGHPILAGLPDETLRRVERAVDTTHIVDAATQTLPGHPNNYWMCLARAERARLRLGLTRDNRMYRLALSRTADLLLASRHGYMDDCREGRGRFDGYTFTAFHCAERILDDLPAGALAPVARAHERLLLALVLPDGRMPIWGRSAETPLGALFACAMLLRHGLARSPDAVLAAAAAIARHVTEEQWRDDAVSVHRRGATHWYLAPFRLLERSLQMLSGLAEVAAVFRATPDAGPAASAPGADTRKADQDLWLAFDDRGAGAWCFRKGPLDIRVPLVDGYTSDYVAAPMWPDVLEQPVDSEMACGVPNVFFGGKRYLPLNHPSCVHHEPGRLCWTTRGLTHYRDFDWWKPRQELAGERVVRLSVEGDTLRGEETWRFDAVPEALGIHFAESLTPVEIEWSCSAPHRAFTVAVDGMREWRSHWNPLRRVHQLDITPARNVRVTYRIRTARGKTGR